MKATDIFKNLSGFLVDEIEKLESADYLEPLEPIDITETPLGHMNEAEKALFTISEDLFWTITTLFGIDEEDYDKYYEFSYWFIDASKDEFLEKCQTLDKFNKVAAIEGRLQYFAACDFLELITSQRFNISVDDFLIFYRENFMVTVQKVNLFDSHDN